VTTGAYTEPSIELVLEGKAIRKAFKHLIPFLFVLFIFSYLDRVNVAFAAVPMNMALKLTATMFAFGSTIFYAGYALCEIPANLMLGKFGARRWLAIILIGWGIASTSTMFAAGATSFYVIRLLVGIAEAGFFPGTLLYLTFWFPSEYRARATGLFLIAQPVTIMMGASVSGLILDHSHGWLGLNLEGWRWLFLLEGMPAVFLGFITYFYLSDGPTKANWLSDAEKATLQRSLQRSEEGSLAAHSGSTSAWAGVFSRNVIILSLIYFCMIVGLNANVLWTPQIIHDMMMNHSLSYIGLLTAIPAACALIIMPIWGARSDRHMERIWHFALPIFGAALGWVMVAILKMPELRMAGFIMCCTGVFTGQVIFWALAPNTLSPAARPVGIAWINMCGIISASISPLLFGFLRDLTESWFASLLFVGLMLTITASLIFLIPAGKKSPAIILTTSENGSTGTEPEVGSSPAHRQPDVLP
jgi:MFS transporter, ACS family, 4-hydroxyphenylacetate permease